MSYRSASLLLSPRELPYKNDGDALLGVKNAVLVSLRMFSLKRSTAGAELTQNMAGDICQSTHFFPKRLVKRYSFCFSTMRFIIMFITAVNLSFLVKQLMFNFVSFTPGIHNSAHSVLNVLF